VIRIDLGGPLRPSDDHLRPITVEVPVALTPEQQTYPDVGDRDDRAILLGHHLPAYLTTLASEPLWVRRGSLTIIQLFDQDGHPAVPTCV